MQSVQVIKLAPPSSDIEMSLIVLKRVLVALLGITIATILLIACLAYSSQFKDITILHDQMVQEDLEVSRQYELIKLYSRAVSVV